MNRAGYCDDIDPLDLGRWRAQVNSAIRGKRGQAFLRDLLEGLDSLSEKKLILGELEDENGCVCALGAAAKKRGIDLGSLDTYDYHLLGRALNIAHQLAQEVMFENDEGADWRGRGTPESRWQHVRAWVVEQLRSDAV